MKTYEPNKNTISRNWHLVDAKDQVLGRLASQIARRLMGKDKRTYAPHVDSGDYVVVVNAQDIKITGANKPVQKIDFRHSGYPGGDTITPYGEFLKKNPERAIRLAVTGMLSKTRLRKLQINRLKVYRGTNHPHSANLAPKKQAATETAAASTEAKN